MVMREAGLVIERRDGWNIYYHVTRPEVYAVLDTARSMVGEQQPEVPTFILHNRSASCPCPKCQAVVTA